MAHLLLTFLVDYRLLSPLCRLLFVNLREEGFLSFFSVLGTRLWLFRAYDLKSWEVIFKLFGSVVVVPDLLVPDVILAGPGCWLLGLSLREVQGYPLLLKEFEVPLVDALHQERVDLA